MMMWVLMVAEKPLEAAEAMAWVGRFSAIALPILVLFGLFMARVVEPWMLRKLEEWEKKYGDNASSE